MLTGNKAKNFWYSALKELGTQPPHQYLNQRVTGYWKCGTEYIVFDNLAGELFTEDFKTKQEVINYLNLQME